MSLIDSLKSSRDRFTFAFGALSFVICIWAQHIKLRQYNRAIANVRSEDDTGVSANFFQNFLQVARLAFPSVWCNEFLGSTVFILLFFVKSLLRVAQSNAKGNVLRVMTCGNANDRVLDFARALLFRGGVALAAACCSGWIEHLRPWLVGCYRERLCRHFQRRFYSKLTYYQATVLDKRLESADTVIATYCAEFAEHFAELPYYFLLPSLECATSAIALTQKVGGRSAALSCAIAAICVGTLQRISPPFGRIHAALLSREDDYRRMLSNGLNNAESIAWHGGGEHTRRKLDSQLGKLKQMLNHLAFAKGNNSILEHAFSGLLQAIASVIIFRAAQGGKKKDLNVFFVELQYMQDLNDSVKDFVVNFREISHLTTFTERLAEFDTTLDSIAHGTFIRPIPTVPSSDGFLLTPLGYTHVNYMGHTTDADCFTLFSFRDVNLSTPTGQVLFNNLNFDITSDQDWAILGENGCGKTSFLRMISGLWPVTCGCYSRDKSVKLLFAPQHSYMVPQCTLLEQIVFPRMVTAAEKSGSAHLEEAIRLAGAQSVVDVLGGFDSPFVGLDPENVDETYDWGSLSGGQKQRISMARVFYHVLTADRERETPVAILDEATSMMDDTEQDVLLNLRRLKVRMISVTHRDEVVGHHTNVLRLHPGGNWEIAPVESRIELDEKLMKEEAIA